MTCLSCKILPIRPEKCSGTGFEHDKMFYNTKNIYHDNSNSKTKKKNR